MSINWVCRWGAGLILLAPPLPLYLHWEWLVGVWPRLAPPLPWQPIELAHGGVASVSPLLLSTNWIETWGRGLY